MKAKQRYCYLTSKVMLAALKNTADINRTNLSWFASSWVSWSFAKRCQCDAFSTAAPLIELTIE